MFGNKKRYNYSWTEIDANKRALFYFARYLDRWDFDALPILLNLA